MFNDLREFINQINDLGECRIVEDADWNLEIGVLSSMELTKPNPSMLLFDKIKGYQAGFRVATNLFSTQRRSALALRLPLEAKGLGLIEAMRERLKKGNRLIPPVEVATGPVKENILTGEDVDILKFPAPKWHEHDGGRYIGTGSITIMRDPDGGWVNLGCYRVQAHDQNTVTIYIESGHQGEIIREKYWAKGLACPVAITCGQDPMLWLASASVAPWGVSEYDIAGGMRNKPIEVVKGTTVDLPIPANAELVLEGEMVAPEVETRQEGPFGEFLGYYGLPARPEPAVRITSILYRDNPIIQGNPPLRWPSSHGWFLQIRMSALLWDHLEQQVPDVRGVWCVGEAGKHSMCVISLKQQYAGHAKQAALAIAGSRVGSYLLRYVIVVDEDIDPSDLSQVMWALGTRSEPEAIDVIRGCWSDVANPTLSPERRQRNELGHSMAIILACKPYYWINEFPKSIYPSPELVNKVREKWPNLRS